MSHQAEERLGDTQQGPDQTQHNTLWRIVHNEHTPLVTTFDTSKVDYAQQLKPGKHGKTTKAVDVSVSVLSQSLLHHSLKANLSKCDLYS